jgi:hypothetical protein
MPQGRFGPEEHPLVQDDNPDDDFGLPGQVLPKADQGPCEYLAMECYGTCTRPTAEGECGFSLDDRGSCGVESRHTGAG